MSAQLSIMKNRSDTGSDTGYRSDTGSDTTFDEAPGLQRAKLIRVGYHSDTGSDTGPNWYSGIPLYRGDTDTGSDTTQSNVEVGR